MQCEPIIFKLFKAEYFPHAENWAVDEKSLIEWVDWELDKAHRSMGALSGALGAKPDGTGANVRDVDLLGFLSLLEGKMAASRAVLGVLLEMHGLSRSREQHEADKAAFRAKYPDSYFAGSHESV